MKVIINSIYNILYQLLTVILPIITVPYVSRTLGEEGIGVQAYSNSIVQYFILFGTIGLNIYGNRQIAYVKDDEEKLRNAFWELWFLRFITISIAISSYLIFFVLFNQKDSMIYILQSLNLFAVLFDISWYYMGIEDFKKTVLRNTLVKIIGVGLIFLCVKDSSDICVYIFILSSTQLIGQLSMWRNVPKIIRFSSISKDILKIHLSKSFHLFIPQIAAQTYLLLDKIMLGIFVDNSAVGLYENSQKIIRLALPIVTSVGVVMIPRMSNLFFKGNMNEFRENIYKVFSFMNFLAFPIMFGIIGIAYSIKPWFFGDEFDGVSILIIISSAIILFGTWCNIFGFQILIPMNKDREFTISVIIGAVINLVLNLLLINEYSALGTTVSSLLAEMIVPLIQLYFLKDIIDLKKLFSGIMKPIVASVLMCILIQIYVPIVSNSFILTILQIISGILLYFFFTSVFKDRNMELVHSFIKKEIILKLKKEVCHE